MCVMLDEARERPTRDAEYYRKQEEEKRRARERARKLIPKLLLENDEPLSLGTLQAIAHQTYPKDYRVRGEIRYQLFSLAEDQIIGMTRSFRWMHMETAKKLALAVLDEKRSALTYHDIYDIMKEHADDSHDMPGHSLIASALEALRRDGYVIKVGPRAYAVSRCKQLDML